MQGDGVERDSKRIKVRQGDSRSKEFHRLACCLEKQPALVCFDVDLTAGLLKVPSC